MIRNRIKKNIYLTTICILTLVIGIAFGGQDILQSPKENNDNYILLYFRGNIPESIKLIPELKAIDLPVTVLSDNNTVEHSVNLTRYVSLAAEGLINGPSRDCREMLPTIPPSTKINSIIINGDTVYIDFTKELADDFWGGADNEQATILSIVNTVTQFAPLNQVQISIEGDSNTSIGGHYMLSLPFRKNNKLVE